MHYVLAVDGGNTKTIALIAKLDGSVVGVGRGGCSDIYNAVADDGKTDSEEVALANLGQAVTHALHSAAVAPSDLAVGVFNMAGADWPEDIAFWQNEMAERGLGRTIIAQNDALGILYAASPAAWGVSVVCGTGAATGARSQDGLIWHSSFWQDEAQGSSHLGQKTLFAIYRAELGLLPPTSLTGRILQHFGVDTVEEVLHLFHNRQHRSPAGANQLTPILLDEAEAGDEVALAVVAEHGALLGDIALAAARKVGIARLPYPLVLSGGVFRHPTAALEQAIVGRVSQSSPEVQPQRSEYEPIVGVLLQALATSGVEIDEPLRDRMYLTLPEGSWQRLVS